MALKAELVHENKVVAGAVLFGGGCVGAPLLEAGHFLREVQLFPAFGLDDPNDSIGGASDEVRGVGGEDAVGFDVVEFEANREVVLGKGGDVGCSFEEGGEFELQPAGACFADEFVEDALFSGEEGAVLGAERAGVLQADMGLNAGGAGVVARRGCDIDLQLKAAIFLQHLVMDVPDALKPRHLGVVDMVGLVVKDCEFFDFADDFAEVRFAVGGLCDGLCAKGIGEEVIAQVVVLQ